jgi:DivIVA domain-containing protein
MLTPDDITKKTFTVKSLRGYDPHEVDDFLDRIVADYSTALTQLAAANGDLSRYRSGAVTAQLPPVPAAPPAPSNPIGDVARLLAVAQQAADQQAAEAKAAADKVIANAHAAGDQIIADANSKAAQVIADGNTKRNEIVGELEVKRSELQSKVDALTATHAEAVNKLKSALAQLGDPAA